MIKQSLCRLSSHPSFLQRLGLTSLHHRNTARSFNTALCYVCSENTTSPSSTSPEDTSKYIKAFSIQSVSKEGTLIESSATTCRTAKIIMDEPVSLGGKGTGPTPLELSLASLSGCELITARYIARSMKMEIKTIECTKMQGKIDVRGMRGVSGIPAHFTHVDMVYEVETDAEDDRIQDLKSRVEKACPVYQLFKAAGVIMNCEWKKKQ
ncbi:hypothetical protein C9374_010298 [Naegleria lovaniensis]|uniref:OsmC-like protein n=1 Tax=Naegleria lovaniensis TaxID=51637 RepID=A0AA88GI02_NAELO|nr:uncharacterized protein C9374_010298 [Naegleria lovaniensis]KAG2374924.1 hypothetical protein C9374_010298 [Naegleria lovaniensis]